MRDAKTSNVTALRRPHQAPTQLPPDLREQVEVYAEIHHINLTEAHRYLIKAGLAAEARAMLESEHLGLDTWCPCLVTGGESPLCRQR